MKLLVSLFLLLGLFAAGTAQAQQQTEQQKYRATVVRMIEAGNSMALYESTVDQLMNYFRQSTTGIPEEFWTGLHEEIGGISMELLVDMLTPIYAKYLTQEDLEQIIAFYESPAGKKMVSVLPALTTEAMEVGQAWGEAIGEKLMERIQARSQE